MARALMTDHLRRLASISALLLAALALLGAVPGRQYAVLSSGRLASGTMLAKGRFLVANRDLRDANFAETVVLLVDYHERGAMGLIINQPTEVRLAKVLPNMAGLQERSDMVYIGGPVDRNRMVLLIRSSSTLEDAQQVMADVYVSPSRKLFERLVDKAGPGERFRVYAGYAGWAPGQLDREVARGDWHVLPADAETVFDKAPADIWPELIRKGAIRWLSF
jgi:putative transcriptional regulator